MTKIILILTALFSFNFAQADITHAVDFEAQGALIDAAFCAYDGKTLLVTDSLNQELFSTEHEVRQNNVGRSVYSRFEGPLGGGVFVQEDGQLIGVRLSRYEEGRFFFSKRTLIYSIMCTFDESLSLKELSSITRFH